MTYTNSLQRRQVGQYLKWLEEEQGLTHRYVSQVQSALLRFVDHCYLLELKQTSQVSPQAVLSFLKNFKECTAGHQRFVATALRKYLVHFENPVMLKMSLQIRGSSRQTVRWLTEEQCEQIFLTVMSPAQKLLVYGPLLNGLRPIEVRRLRIKDVRRALETGRIRVWAKRKEREIALHDDLAILLRQYLITKDLEDDDALLLGVQRTKAETELKKVSIASGVAFTGYDLRRTWGKIMHSRGVDIETIGEIYGHEDVRVTRRYIGITTDRQRKALACYGIARLSTAKAPLA